MEITVKNNQEVLLRSGQYAEVHIPLPEKKKLVISKECIIGSMEKPTVFVIENGVAKEKKIITGESDNDSISVISGLKEGDLVVYSGQLNLIENDKVKVIN